MIASTAADIPPEGDETIPRPQQAPHTGAHRRLGTPSDRRWTAPCFDPFDAAVRRAVDRRRPESFTGGPGFFRAATPRR